MRIDKLRLDRYGFHFKRGLDFPAPASGAPDLHIVVGDNATGKSSICAAVTDLLFGIPHLSRWAIGYEPSQLTIGALIQDRSGRALDFNRFKTRRDNLASPDGQPIDEALLKSYMGEIDKRTFEALYALDQASLRQGGEEMLKTKSDVGQTIFAAASGLATLSDVKEALKAESDAISGQRKSAERPIWKAEQQYREASLEAQAAALRSEEWTEADRAFRDAKAARGKLALKSTGLEEERGRIERQIRTLPVLHELDRLRAVQSRLKDAKLLPTDFAARRSAAVLAHDQASAAHSRASAIETKRRKTRDDLPDGAGPLPGFCGEIEGLNTRIGSIGDLIHDAAKLERDQEKIERRLEALAGNLGVKQEDAKSLIEKIPAEAEVSRVRELVIEESGLSAKLKLNREASAGAAEALDAAGADLKLLGSPAEPKDAAAEVYAARNLEADAKKFAADRVAFEGAEKAEALALQALKGWSGAPETLLVAVFPASAAIVEAKNRILEAERALSTAADKVVGLEEEIARLEGESGAGVTGEVPVAAAVEGARTTRDRQWRAIRNEVEAGARPEETALDGFEAGISTADRLIDKRLGAADTVAKQDRIESELAAKRKLLEAAVNALDVAEKARDAKTETAAGLWKGSAYAGEVGVLDVMIAWLAAKEKAAEAIKTRMARAEALEASKTACNGEIAALRRAAASLGVTLDPTFSGIAAIEAAAAKVVQALEKAREAWTRSGQLQAEIRRREGEAEKAKTAIGEAERDIQSWTTRWTQAMPAIGLAADAAPELAKERLGHWAKFSEEAVNLAAIEGRLDGIRDDLAAHRMTIESLVKKIGGAFENAPDEDAWSEWPALLYRKLGAALTTGKAIEDAEDDLREAVREKTAAEETERVAETALKALLAAAGIAEGEDVDTMIEESALKRETEAAIATNHKALAEAGDDLDEAALLAELGEKTRAELAAASTQNTAARESLLDEVQEAADALAQSRTKLKALEAKAGYRAKTQEALIHAATVGQLARRWMRLTAARAILDATIERYRQSHEGPMVARVGEIFIAIAGNQAPDFFTRLEVNYEKPSDPHLIAMRASGTAARVEELSEGTRDQLWLAFRIAALENRAKESEPMPFLADDLFASSDPTRAEAGIRYLIELARSNQVILFAHHDHVATAALRLLPGVKVHRLTREPALSIVA
jgi:uncharacterized protein YhaN